MSRSLAALLACAVLLATGAQPLQAAEEAHAHWTVSTTDPKTQQLFDRGLAMLYAFNEGEARVIFAQAAARDPELAMAYWGMAAADTIDVNRPSTPEGEQRGADAARKARAHLAHATPEERALVGAIGARYAKGSEKQKFSRYAASMSAYTKAHRDEPNALVIAGFANYVAEDALLDGKDAMTPKAREILDDVDRALVLESSNLGAHHLRLHLLEETRRPKDAIPNAEALSSYVYPPGESHLPHMSGHIWSRIGDYDRLAADNQRAVANDRAWFTLGDGPGQQYMKYYHDHDVDFVLYGLTTVGREPDARTAAKEEDASMRTKLALRLHDDAQVVAIGSDAGAFARGIAAARSGTAATARTERDKLDKTDTVHRALIDAAIARRAGDAGACVAAYALAYTETKTSNPGDPKDYWMVPIGEGYGAALLGAGKAAQAETVFTAELVRFPNDPHLEWGLAEAQLAQHKDDSAARAAYKAHWKGTSDLTLDRLG